MRIMTRMTKQKRLITEELKEFDSFFSAEDLYRNVMKRDSRIGIATIYRFLKELRESHQLHSYLCARRLVYSKELNNHGHFICQRCNRIIHFDVDSIDFLVKKFKGTICHFLIDVSGICDQCLNDLDHT